MPSLALPQYNVEELIANIKRRCSVPTSQLTYLPQDFALLANDTLQGEVVPLIMSTREEYFVDWYDFAAPYDGIVEISGLATGAKLRSVCYIQQSNPLLLVGLPRIDLDVIAGVGWANNISIAGFYVQGDYLILWPNTNIPVGTQMRIYYYRRSLVLAQPTEYGQIRSIDTLTNTIVMTRVPTTWGVGSELNAVSSVPNFKITAPLVTVTAISSPSLVLDTVEGLEVGDYVTLYGFSAVPQIPVEAHAYLAQLTAAKCLEGLGDREGMQAALGKAETLKTNLLIMTSQRVDGSVKKIMNPNGGLRLGAGLGRWGRGSSGGAY